MGPFLGNYDNNHLSLMVCYIFFTIAERKLEISMLIAVEAGRQIYYSIGYVFWLSPAA